MIRAICKDAILLSRPSTPATAADLPVLRDLTDTLSASLDRCVGMAANMIGVNKRIIVYAAGGMVMGMLNPTITKRSAPYEAEEGCLSLSGTRKTTRYHTIEVDWLDAAMKPHHARFEGFIAQIIQHEVDHCDGIII